MNKKELLDFAINYSTDQFDQIKFDWNGIVGTDFMDSNINFRIELCEVIKDDLSVCSDQLILDLYLELAKSAKETFSVYNSFHLFANEILERGGVQYFDQYLEGASQSMDTGMSSGILNLSQSRIEEILIHIKHQINHFKEIKGYDYMLRRFEWLSKNNSTT